MCHGCLSVTFMENDTCLEVDKEQLNVMSDFLTGDTVIDSVMVRSNRSWDAEIIPAVDWITLDRREFEDLEGVTREVPLRLSFADNKSEYPRVASLMITSGDNIETVKIVQSALTPRLVVNGTGHENLAFDGDSCVFEVLSNVDWSVEVSEKSEDIGLTLENAVRNGGGSVKVTLAEHFNLESSVYADIIFSGEDCESVVMRVTQAKAVPYARIINVEGGEEILPSIGGTRKMIVKSNVNWTIGVKEEGVDNVTFSPNAGGKGETSVLMTFEGTPSFDARRDITARCETQLVGEDDGRNQWMFTQEKGSLMRFLFLYGGKWYWPFYCKNGEWPKKSLSIGSPEAKGKVEVFETYAGYELKLFSNYGYVFGNQGIRFGHSDSILGDYIELPAIEGRSLVQVNWIPDEDQKYYTLPLHLIEGGSLENPIVGEPEEGLYQDGVRTWRLSGKQSQVYWLVPTQNKTYSVEILECIYE